MFWPTSHYTEVLYASDGASSLVIGAANAWCMNDWAKRAVPVVGRGWAVDAGVGARQRVWSRERCTAVRGRGSEDRAQRCPRGAASMARHLEAVPCG